MTAYEKYVRNLFKGKAFQTKEAFKQMATDPYLWSQVLLHIIDHHFDDTIEDSKNIAALITVPIFAGLCAKDPGLIILYIVSLLTSIPPMIRFKVVESMSRGAEDELGTYNKRKAVSIVANAHLLALSKVFDKNAL